MTIQKGCGLVWRDIKGFENLYQVNENGDVKSLKRRGTEIILKPALCGRGYKMIDLRKNNETFKRYNHRLVAEAYVDNPYGYKVVNHIDGNKLNNNYENIEWVSYSMNNQHAYDTKLKSRGESFYNAKLSNEDAREILANGKYSTYQDIADKYGVSKATVRDVLMRKTWKHINT